MVGKRGLEEGCDEAGVSLHMDGHLIIGRSGVVASPLGFWAGRALRTILMNFILRYHQKTFHSSRLFHSAKTRV